MQRLIMLTSVRGEGDNSSGWSAGCCLVGNWIFTSCQPRRVISGRTWLLLETKGELGSTVGGSTELVLGRYPSNVIHGAFPDFVVVVAVVVVDISLPGSSSWALWNNLIMEK